MTTLKKRIGRWGRSMKRRPRSELIGRLWVGGLVLVLLVSLWGGYRAVRFVYETPALGIRSVSVSGLERVREGEILARAGFTAGTNLLSVDLDQVRVSVERIQWVRHARVQRIWPREIAITVVEREPMALARLDGQIFQVDEDGVVLPLDIRGGTDFPILEGLRHDDTDWNLARIRVYREMLDLIGEAGLSEVHVTDAGEVSVVPSDMPIVVELGMERYPERWEKYLQLKPRIRAEYPGVSRVDLRFEDQVIIQQRGGQPSESMTWDEETRLL